MFAELKGTIKIRHDLEEELKHPTSGYTEEIEPMVIAELELARQIVKAFLTKGQAKTINTLLGRRVASWLNIKTIHIPKEGSLDPSTADIYHITVKANFPKPVEWENRIRALDKTELVIVMSGDHHVEVKTTLLPVSEAYRYPNNLSEIRTNLAYAREVVEMIRRDPYVPKTILEPNPEPNPET